MALTGLTNLQPLHIKTVGIGTFDNTVSIGGTLTYEDVTNVDAIGIITARSGINVSAGQLDVGNNIKLGNAGVITATSFVGSGANLTGVLKNIVEDSSPQLGADLDTNNHHILFADDRRLKLGNSTDFQIWHSPNNNSYIKNSTGELFITSDNITIKNTDQSETFIDCNVNASVSLYYDDENKFSTDSFGATTRHDNGTISKHRLTTNGGTTRGYLYADSGNEIGFRNNSDSINFKVTSGGDAYFYARAMPVNNNAQDLGSTSLRWRNIYTNDLNLSNKGSTNSVDNTWGDYTIQEGESDLYLINNRNGKKYKFNLTEVS